MRRTLKISAYAKVCDATLAWQNRSFICDCSFSAISASLRFCQSTSGILKPSAHNAMLAARTTLANVPHQVVPRPSTGNEDRRPRLTIVLHACEGNNEFVSIGKVEDTIVFVQCISIRMSTRMALTSSNRQLCCTYQTKQWSLEDRY